MRKKLFWLTTPCNLENWFAIASSQKKAEEFHEDAEGFNRNYAKAQFVCNITSDLIKIHEQKLEDEGWPSHELLEALGFHIIKSDSPRVVNYDGKVYTEGRSVEGMIIEMASKKEGVYVLNLQGTSEYKIGITKDLSKRIKQFETGNP